ncbi:TIGR00730 family Rossman fold protein [Telmatospirillum sp.]|uniref:LOG family protein n=1 Tax=Telmatospirillum sp. TaxID=2079197 RepID=UPI00284A4BAF|nr:TIGR00730 family Rossman fold protein [Telmatospirillum sp.]MDR3435930.1 TIGR00730 family Rossman fold protein [Telmatospirillum sp.]
MTNVRSSQLGSLCVFCGAAMGNDPHFREAAERLGRHLAEAGVTLVYGGGHVGLMGALAETVMSCGGKVIGVIPEHLLKVEASFKEASELIVVDSMHTRKHRMFDLADGFCVLPGGLGTLDETFEILTWKQLKLHNKPVILANIDGYWAPWLQLVDGIIAKGFAQPGINRLYSVVDNVDDVLASARREIVAAHKDHSKLF